MQKANQEELRIEKVIKRKGDKLHVKWKGYDNSFNSWIDKKDSINGWIFSETKFFRRKCKSWIRFVRLCNKNRFKKCNRVDTSSFTKRIDLANLKSDVDKLDIDKLENVPSGLISLKSNADKLDVDKLVPVIVDLIN